MAIVPKPLRAGDRVRLVSPSSPADRKLVERFVPVLESWGLVVELGAHVYDRIGFLAGTDEHRLADFNDALRDPGVRAIIATRGGKGAYRIADKLDFAAARNDPKLVVGFSDVTVLQLALLRHAGLVTIHGPDALWAVDVATSEAVDALRHAITTNDPIVLNSDPRAETAVLTTSGMASGPLIGGNLELIATGAGWATPSLEGGILLLEAIDLWLGQIDRALTMLISGGHLRGVRGVAVGHFTQCMSKGEWTYLDVLRDRLSLLGVPILGGLPVGHQKHALTVPLGVHATLDAAAGTLHIAAR